MSDSTAINMDDLTTSMNGVVLGDGSASSSSDSASEFDPYSIVKSEKYGKICRMKSSQVSSELSNLLTDTRLQGNYHIHHS